MAEHKPGSMDIRTQERTFASFIRWVAWGTIFCIATLIFMGLANA